MVVAIDGRSGAGKSTLADRIVQAIPGAQVAHTDDIAWFHSSFDWTQALMTGVLAPLAAGRDVHYRPPGWVLHDREGWVDISAQAPLVIVEGVGSSRRELGPAIDCAIWVQSDVAVSKKRGILRDTESLGDAAEQQWHDWQEEEGPFLLIDEPWLRADVILGGSDQLTHDYDTEVIVASSMRSPTESRWI